MTDKREPLSVNVEDDRPDPGTARQPPPADPITDPPPRHDPHAHGTGAPPPQQEPGWWHSTDPPPRPPRTAPNLRGDDRRLHDKLTQTYATVGLVVCAGAATRMQVLGPVDPTQPVDHDQVRAMRATVLMDRAGQTTVAMAPAAADAWLEVAREVPAVKRALNQFMEGGAVLGLVMVHAMMLIPYGVAAGWVPEIIGERMNNVGAAMGAAASQDGNGG